MLKEKRFYGYALLCLLFAAALRLHNLDAQSVWFDEGWSAYAASRTSMWYAANADTTNPPLYYILLYVHAALTGHDIFVLRWLSFAFGMLSTALIVRLTAHITKRKTAILPALVLAAVNIPLIWASQEMRMYTLLAVLISVMALAWEQLRTHPTRAAWGLLLITELAALYTHNTGPVIVLWLNAVTVLAWVIRRKPPLMQWLLGQVVVGILWLPYFTTRFLLVATANNALVRRTPLDLNLWGAYWLAPWEALLDVPTVIWWSLPALVSMVILTPWRRAAVRWLALHIVVLTVGLYVSLAVLGNELHGRYFVMITPLVIALAASGFGSQDTVSSLRRIMRGAAFITFLLPSIIGWQWLQHPAYQHDDTEGMVQHYTNTLTAQDTVLAWSYADRYELAYYWNQWDIPIQRITLPEGADLPDVLPLLPQSGDISFNVWYTQRADYRGMMSCMLGHGTTTEPEFYEVSGMATLTYRSPVLAIPPMQPTNAQFAVAAVNSVSQLPDDFTANQAACIPVTVTLQGQTSGELKAALIAENPLGDEIARADAIFATANQRTSVDNTVGEPLTAYPLLRLPYGAPPTDYTLKLRIYDEQNLSGYDVLVDGTAAGKDWTIGTWTPITGAQWQTEGDHSGLQLIYTESSHQTEVRNGDTVRLTLLWEGNPNTPLPTLTLRADEWAIDVPPLIMQHDNAVLDWREFQIPLDAPSGEAVLSLSDGEIIARFTVTEIPLQTDPPSFTYPANVTFPDIGEVIGYDMDMTADELQVTLIWRVDKTPTIDRDYTVFVQALAPQVITQSDSQPAAGTRPTTGWRANEIIADTHTLPLSSNNDLTDSELIFGLYDNTGTRVTLENGETYAVLRGNLGAPP